MADNDKILDILNNNNVVIPASLLHILVQYIDASVKRGGVVAEEMTLIGKCYEMGKKVLSELIQSKLNEGKTDGKSDESGTVTDSIAEPVVTKKKVKKVKEQQQV